MPRTKAAMAFGIACLGAASLFWLTRPDPAALPERPPAHPAPRAATIADPPLAPPHEPPLQPRPDAAFPGGELVKLGPRPALVWPAVRQSTPWLVIDAELPAGLDAVAGLRSTVEAAWRKRDVAAAILLPVAASETGTLALALAALSERPDGANRRAVLLGVGARGCESLQLAGEAQVQALALVDPPADCTPPSDNPSWQPQVAKKFAWLAGPEDAGGPIRLLGDRLGNARKVVDGRERGVAWLNDAGHRAAFLGWVNSVLGL